MTSMQDTEMRGGLPAFVAEQSRTNEDFFTTTTYSKGKHHEVGFLKCQPTEQPTSLPTGHGNNVTGEPIPRAQPVTGSRRV